MNKLQEEKLRELFNNKTSNDGWLDIDMFIELIPQIQLILEEESELVKEIQRMRIAYSGTLFFNGQKEVVDVLDHLLQFTQKDK